MVAASLNILLIFQINTCNEGEEGNIKYYDKNYKRVGEGHRQLFSIFDNFKTSHTLLKLLNLNRGVGIVVPGFCYPESNHQHHNHQLFCSSFYSWHDLLA